MAAMLLRLRLLLGTGIHQPHLVSVDGTSSSLQRYVAHDIQLLCPELQVVWEVDK